jgi:hypothetical protein
MTIPPSKGAASSFVVVDSCVLVPSLPRALYCPEICDSEWLLYASRSFMDEIPWALGALAVLATPGVVIARLSDPLGLWTDSDITRALASTDREALPDPARGALGARRSRLVEGRARLLSADGKVFVSVTLRSATPLLHLRALLSSADARYAVQTTRRAERVARRLSAAFVRRALPRDRASTLDG